MSGDERPVEPTRQQLAELARQLAATTPSEIDCEATLERVAAYLEASRGGGEVAPELRLVGQHLEVCPACHEEFESLLRAIEAGSP